ncbi:hypothetical protein [Paenibacillus odorifer]|uniref:Peptide zinc metalloprotease protein n=1 Tax=Paenibacillus odorifer TaxID=189426 RepID=A0A1R0XV36_9BACL|nr:hypothetical protein [Paenibacillus odorifer]OMD38827.1 hypothetical protein BSK52_18100 [Paenibacillus odorifer]
MSMEGLLQVKQYETRQELDVDGNSFYILSFDQSSHIKVSPRAKEIIDKLDGTNSNEEIINDLNAKGISITDKEFDYFIKKFLVPKNMMTNSSNKSGEKKKSYLWLHLPIIESSKFRGLYSILKYLLYSRWVVIPLLIIVSICGVFSVMHLSKYPTDIFNNLNTILVIFLVYLSMFIHELGHATAAYKYDVNVGKIGIGIYLTYFVFFIDMTNTWRLDKNKRIINDVSGMYFQVLTTIPIFVCYMISHNISLLIGIVLILMTSAMNLIPFLRMDGYWLLSDYLNVQNIQVKAFKSIKEMTVELINAKRARKMDENYSISKSVYVYGIYSSVYVLTTCLIILSLLYSVMGLIQNHDLLINKFISLQQNIIHGNISNVLVDLNNLFILFIPVIFVVSLLASFLKRLYLTLKIKGGLKAQ